MMLYIRKRCIEAIKRSGYPVSRYIRHILRNALMLDMHDFNDKVKVSTGRMDENLKQKVHAMPGSKSAYVDRMIEKKMKESGFWR